MIKTIMFISLPLLLMGCANEPIVDRRGVDEQEYQDDLAECRSYAYQVDTAGETAKAGAIGIAVGASVGAILGDSHDAERGAGVGALAGGTKGFRRAEQRKEKVLYRCMKSRGYRVFG
jgi:outer membrane lipoprotein SlyB